MLKLNETGKYPGAFYVASDVVTQIDCCNAQSVQLLAALCVAAGAAYSIIGGEIYMELTTPDLLDECQGVAPTISTMDFDDWEDVSAINITAADKGVTEGEVWVGDAATWAGSVVKAQQSVTTWAGATILIATNIGAFGASPPVAYCYVMNACGRPNAAGYEIDWVVI